MMGMLDGRRILILEDEFLAALDMESMIEAHGGAVVGPVSRVGKALELVETEELDGAILDVNLNGQKSFPVADALRRKGVAFIFATGYDSNTLPDRFASATMLNKPLTPAAVDKALQQVFGTA